MTPDEFIDRWRSVTRTERSAAQEHFLDLCALLGVPKPADIDRHGTEYTFEKTTRKIGGATGFCARDLAETRKQETSSLTFSLWRGYGSLRPVSAADRVPIRRPF